MQVFLRKSIRVETLFSNTNENSSENKSEFFWDKFSISQTIIENGKLTEINNENE